MIDLVRDKQDQLRALCRKHDVKALYLFGSATGDEFDPERSDLDFAVEFTPRPRRGFDDVYFRLLEDLCQLFGREVDLVEKHVVEQSENYIRRERILSSLELLYAA